jgi:3-methyladenine DNA glycosylase Tag
MATNSIFCSGFNWRVVQAKWDGFEEVFEGFDLGRWIFSNDDDLGRLVSDTRIIRNGMKIKTVPENACFFGEIAKEHGSVGAWIGNWPSTDQIGLMDQLKRRGSRLGMMTGQYFLRFMGKDCFILSRDVVAALVRAGIVDKQPTSQKALLATQLAFNGWMEESGLGLTAISRTLAHSIDG